MTPGSKSASVPTATAHQALTAGPEPRNQMLLHRQEMWLKATKLLPEVTQLGSDEVGIWI